MQSDGMSCKASIFVYALEKREIVHTHVHSCNGAVNFAEVEGCEGRYYCCEDDGDRHDRKFHVGRVDQKTGELAFDLCARFSSSLPIELATPSKLFLPDGVIQLTGQDLKAKRGLGNYDLYRLQQVQRKWRDATYHDAYHNQRGCFFDPAFSLSRNEAYGSLDVLGGTPNVLDVYLLMEPTISSM